MTLRKYHNHDLFEVVPKDILKKYGVMNVRDSDLNHSWTLLDNGVIVGCAGFRMFWPGVFECWLAAKSYEAFYRHRYMIIRLVKRKLKSLKAHRIQATIDSNQPLNIRFIKFLGFKHEATLHKYGIDGADFELFALVK